MTVIETIKKHLENIRIGFIDEQREKEMRASGKSADSLMSKVYRKGNSIIGELSGVDYWEDQEKGGHPNPSLEQEEIEKWMEHKGIASSEPEKEQNRIAFLITRKLQEEGWNTSGERVDTTQIVQREIYPLLLNLGEASSLEIRSQILDAYKRK